jgi:hypothetical protein
MMTPAVPAGHFEIQAVVDLRSQADRTVCETVTRGQETRITSYIIPEFSIRRTVYAAEL